VNERLDRVVDVCVEYVLNVEDRGRDWIAELVALEITLRSQVRSLVNEFVTSV